VGLGLRFKENNEDPIGLQSDLLARAIVIFRDKRLEKRAADHIRAFEKIADQHCLKSVQESRLGSILDGGTSLPGSWASRENRFVNGI
jgi:hypothetical protein